MGKLSKPLHESKAMRWTALFIVSFTLMCSYFMTDVMAPLEDLLTTDGQITYYTDGSFSKTEETAGAICDKEVECALDGLGWSSTEYGFFTGAYGYFNVFLLMLLFGGIILDKMAVRFTGTLAAALMLGGAAIK